MTSPATGFKFQAAHRLEGVSESATLKLNATVQALKAKGVDVVNLTAGEPDFQVPFEAQEAVKKAMLANQSKYTPVPGISELREAVAEKTNRQQPSLSKPSQRGAWKASNVVVSNGGKQALFNSFMALLNPGDEVLIPSPYWLSYPEMAMLVGAVPRFIQAPASQGFKITPEQLRNALSAHAAKIKIVVFNSPSNPTGAMYSSEEFKALGKVLLETPGAEKIWIISDEIYDRILLGSTPFCSFLEAVPELAHRTITINGVSKSAAMTGWRIGWSVAPESATQAMITIQGQSTSGINALAQWASLAALKIPESHFAEQVKTYQRRRTLVLENLKKARKIELINPEGAFYVFFGVTSYLRSGEDSIGFAQRLLEEAKVALVPGTPFGEPGFLRLSFATDEKSLQEGCDRILHFLQ